MTEPRNTPANTTDDRLATVSWALAGVAAGAAGIAASELAAGLLPGFPSLVVAVGTQVIALQPPGAKDLMVNLFGTNDKLALNIFIVAVALIVAAGVGLLARRHGGAATLVIVGFGVVGFAAAAAEADVTISVALLSALIAAGFWCTSHACTCHLRCGGCACRGRLLSPTRARPTPGFEPA